MGIEELMLSNCNAKEDFESLLDGKEINPVNLKGNQSSIFIGRTDAKDEAEAKMLWPSDVKSQHTEKDHGLTIAKNRSLTA